MLKVVDLQILLIDKGKAWLKVFEGILGVFRSLGFLRKHAHVPYFRDELYDEWDVLLIDAFDVWICEVVREAVELHLKFGLGHCDGV